MEKYTLELETSLAPDELRSRLKKWEPWSIRVDFTNGVSTQEFKKRIPFSEHPLSKFRVIEPAIPFAELAGGRFLDIGCNVGYNSIPAATKYKMSCTRRSFSFICCVQIAFERLQQFYS
jgi:hypothetical protein